LIHKFGREAAERIVEEHYRRYQPNIGSSLDEHRREFAAAWEGMRRKLADSLSPEEQQAFNRLRSEHQREGFLIVRAFDGVAGRKREKDFTIAQASLADRLSITLRGAADVIQKLCEKVIAQTQPYVRHKSPARFCWLLPRSTSPCSFSARAREGGQPRTTEGERRNDCGISREV
jgi:hypothetical protein